MMKKLVVGDKAPDFSGEDQNGKQIKLSDFKGKKLALLIYVSDGSKGCVMDLEDIQAHLKELNKNGIQVVGVSKNSLDSHKRFAEKHGFEFSLLSDHDLNIIKAYGAFGPKKTSKGMKDGVLRTNILIDENGKIESVIFPVDIHNAAGQILEQVKG